MKIVVIAPHPDDEVLGVGGTIARSVSEGHEVQVVIVTKGTDDIFSADLIEKGRAEAKKAHFLLGVTRTIFLDFPAAKLDTIERHIINKAISEVINEVMPEIVFLPFRGDMHIDHQIVFDAAMVAIRPNKPKFPCYVFMYETLSETNWNDYKSQAQFVPDVYINISDYLETKMNALKCYASQIQSFPNERSEDSIYYLAKLRGSTVNHEAAEAFSLVRMVVC